MHNKAIFIGTCAAFFATLSGCGGSGGKDTSMQDEDEFSQNSASNIPYLKRYHANYSEYGSMAVPAPDKDDATMSIRWTIETQREEDAQKLADHIVYMEERLKEGKIPRRFDRLFVAEAYMKYYGYYTTSVDRSGTVVVVEKKANNACTYAIISAHSDAVSGDFFARGDTSKDYSPIADFILNTEACRPYKEGVERYGSGESGEV